MAEENQAAQKPDNEDKQPGFGIEKIYVKDLSLEIPNAPQIFTQRETPQLSVELSNAVNQLDDGVFEVAITVTVTSKVEEKTVFLVEVAQAGIFQVRNIPAENLDMILGVTCPNILFPYARETVSDVVIRAGFPPVLLNPINFEALYAQQRQQAQVAEEGAAAH